MDTRKKLLFLILTMPFQAALLCHPALSDEAGGDDAYTYLTAISSQYPERVFADGRSAAMGDHLIDELTVMGYSPVVQSFEASEFILDRDGASPGQGRNIYVDIPGQTGKMILIGAHYDCVNTQGCDDNASGVAVLLSLAKNLKDKTPPCTVRIMFFDDEEEGMLGSGSYCLTQPLSFFDDLLFMINIDSIAGGDNMMIHGGDPAGSFTQARDYALSRASSLGLNFVMHGDVEGIPAGTRFGGSDHLYFARRMVPYIYIEAGVYSDDSIDGNPVHFQTSSNLVDGNAIMHSRFDDMQVIEEIFPGRIRKHLGMAYDLCEDLLLHTDTDMSYTKTGNSNVPYVPSTDSRFYTGVTAVTDEVYTEGEILSASGISVMMNYSDGSTSPAAYWIAKGQGGPAAAGDNIISIFHLGRRYDLHIYAEPLPSQTEETTNATPEETTSVSPGQDPPPEPVPSAPETEPARPARSDLMKDFSPAPGCNCILLPKRPPYSVQLYPGEYFLRSAGILKVLVTDYRQEFIYFRF